MQSTPLTPATCLTQSPSYSVAYSGVPCHRQLSATEGNPPSGLGAHVTQAATLCPKVDNFLHNTSWIYGNSPPARYVPSPATFFPWQAYYCYVSCLFESLGGSATICTISGFRAAFVRECLTSCLRRAVLYPDTDATHTVRGLRRWG